MKAYLNFWWSFREVFLLQLIQQRFVNAFNGLANNGVLIIHDKMFNDTKFTEDLFSSLPNTFEHSQYSSIVATKHNQKINIAHYSDIIFNELKSENSSRNDVVNILQKK